MRGFCLAWQLGVSTLVYASHQPISLRYIRSDIDTSDDLPVMKAELLRHVDLTDEITDALSFAKRFFAQITKLADILERADVADHSNQLSAHPIIDSLVMVTQNGGNILARSLYSRIDRLNSCEHALISKRIRPYVSQAIAAALQTIHSADADLRTVITRFVYIEDETKRSQLVDALLVYLRFLRRIEDDAENPQMDFLINELGRHRTASQPAIWFSFP